METSPFTEGNSSLYCFLTPKSYKICFGHWQFGIAIVSLKCIEGLLFEVGYYCGKD